MIPSYEQIEQAAYHRWIMRGGRHGEDRNDWTSAEKDLLFALNYRWIARQPLVPVGQAGSAHELKAGRRRICRFCEQAESVVRFAAETRALPILGGFAIEVCGDECEGCRNFYESTLAAPLEVFSRLLLQPEPTLFDPGATIPPDALKGLVRIGLSVLPGSEIHHFDDALDWVANPDHSRDNLAIRSANLGCRIYLTPEPVGSAFASLARRIRDEAPFPYVLLFLGVDRVVFQINLPFSPRDDDLEDAKVGGPILSMTWGRSNTLRESVTLDLPLGRS